MNGGKKLEHKDTYKSMYIALMFLHENDEDYSFSRSFSLSQVAEAAYGETFSTKIQGRNSSARSMLLKLEKIGAVIIQDNRYRINKEGAQSLFNHISE